MKKTNDVVNVLTWQEAKGASGLFTDDLTIQIND